MPNRARRTLMATTLFSALAGHAQGSELCVVCAEPAMTYRCALQGDTQPGNAPPGLQLLCIKELATRGGHKSCSIDRTHTAENCNAVLVTVAAPTGDAAPAPAAPAAPPPSPASDQTPPAPIPKTGPAAKDTPPPTVEALAKQTADQSKKDWEKSQIELKESATHAGQKLEQTGSAIGSAVKKSWDCLASLFSKC